MKILLVSDEEDIELWTHYEPGALDGLDLILSAGDLKADYLNFLFARADCPVLYVRGNHDGSYKEHPPEGCYCLDDKAVKVKGLRILGLGGSMRYNDGPCQYTERQMARRVRRAGRKIRRLGGVDLVLTHAPAKGWGDMDDLTHRGFECFLQLIDKWKPAFFVHGHVHPGTDVSVRRCGSTVMINAFGKYLLDTEAPPLTDRPE